MKWYRLAADQGNAEAQRWLGDCYFFGHGVGKNKREAVTGIFCQPKKEMQKLKEDWARVFILGMGLLKTGRKRYAGIVWLRNREIPLPSPC